MDYTVGALDIFFASSMITLGYRGFEKSKDLELAREQKAKTDGVSAWKYASVIIEMSISGCF